MATFAIYRCLYGADFVTQSIESVLPFVDEVAVVWGRTPWAGVSESIYKGKRYKFPERFDDLPERVKAMDDPRVHLIEHHSPSPRNQWTELTEQIVVPKLGKPDILMFMHVGMVWRQQELAEALAEFIQGPDRFANTWMVELWRGFNWRIPRRHRVGAGFWNRRRTGHMPPTELDFNPMGTPLAHLPMLGEVHNFRYAQNPNLMFWRHLAITEYVKKVGDSKPNPDHFEDKWLNWTPETRDIEMSLNYKHTVPCAIPYDETRLPEPILRDMEALRAQTSNEAWKGFPQCE
jgi:hypothetical protein